MADLATWTVDDVKWDRRSPSVGDRQRTGGGDVEKGEVAEATSLNCAAQQVYGVKRNTHSSFTKYWFQTM